MPLRLGHLSGMSKARRDKKTVQISATWRGDAVMMEFIRDKTRHLIFGRPIPKARPRLLRKSRNMVYYMVCSRYLYIY